MRDLLQDDLEHVHELDHFRHLLQVDEQLKPVTEEHLRTSTHQTTDSS